MRKVLKKISIATLTLGLSILIFSSCSDDIVLEPLDTLLGEYDGHYKMTDLSQGGSGVVKADLAVNWIFRDFTYGMEDTSGVICSPKGDYELDGDGITLEENFDGTEGTVCDPTLNPDGVFSIQRPADSLIMIQNIDNQKIEIRLKKINR